MRAQRFSLLWDGCPRWPSLCVGKGNGYGGKRTQGAHGGVGQGDTGLARAFRVAAGIYPDQRRMRDRAGQRGDSPHITGEYGGAAFVLLYLVFLRSWQRPSWSWSSPWGASQRAARLRRPSTSCSRAKWHWFSVGLYRLHDLDDVLHHRVRMDDPYARRWRRACSTAPMRRSRARVQRYAGESRVADRMDGRGRGGRLFGVQLGPAKGVERVTKVMMATLFVVMIALVHPRCHAAWRRRGHRVLPGARLGRLFADGWSTFGDAVYATWARRFSALSLGHCGHGDLRSRIGRQRSLTGEAVSSPRWNTVVAILAGLIISPACFAYGASDQGPSLVFVTLPVVFGADAAGQRGLLVLVFMAFALAVHRHRGVREPDQLVHG